MSTIKMEHYSRALDEVFHLRALLAYEALVTRAHLQYKTFPKSRREIAEGQVRRMEAAARGDSARVLAPISWTSLKVSLRKAGAEECLTREQWEEED